MNIYEKLLTVQTELKAPKNQKNTFGGYNYRNCEDILEALKPLLSKVKATLIIEDDLTNVEDRYYVKAIAHFIDTEGDHAEIRNVAFAREEESKKGMDGSQVTGASSSYARKYALNGLFAIDDTKDSDYTNGIVEAPTASQIKQLEKYGTSIEKLAEFYKTTKEKISKQQVQELLDKKAKKLEEERVALEAEQAFAGDSEE